MQQSDITREDARSYLARKELFQLFESLLTALLYRRPEDPIAYMEKCMQQAKESKSLKWDSFLDVNMSEGSHEIQNRNISHDDVKDAIEKIFKTEPVEVAK